MGSSLLTMGRGGPGEEALGTLLLDDSTAVQEDHLVGKPPGLADVVGHEHDLGPRPVGLEHQVLDGPRRGRVQAGRRLVEEEHLRPGAERPGDGEALLLAPRQHARRVPGQVGEAGRLEHRGEPALALGPRDPAHGQRVAHVRGDRPAQQHGPLEDHGLASDDRGGERPSPRTDGAGRRSEKPVEQAQQDALSGAVRTHDDGASPGSDGEVDAVDQPLTPDLEDEPPGLDRQHRVLGLGVREVRGGQRQRARHKPPGPRSTAAPSPPRSRRARARAG
jgi:hypothetical protein